ncbi:NAD(P)H-dependent glycerol-3-phosphate dehydrogenase, partial [Escherichia coli]
EAGNKISAMARGVSRVMRFGWKRRSADSHRGRGERCCLCGDVGANPSAFRHLRGVDDGMLTCTDNQSRNRRFGMMLGQGMDVQSAQEKIGQVVEGYRNTKEVRELAHRFGVEMPITEEIYQVLYYGKNAREAALTLLGRARKDERSSH